MSVPFSTQLLQHFCVFSIMPSQQVFNSVQFSEKQFDFFLKVRLFVTPWIAARQASLSITNSQSSLRLTSIKSVMPSSYLILCCPLLLLMMQIIVILVYISLKISDDEYLGLFLIFIPEQYRSILFSMICIVILIHDSHQMVTIFKMFISYADISYGNAGSMHNFHFDIHDQVWTLSIKF